jgi:hypothetical protein
MISQGSLILKGNGVPEIEIKCSQSESWQILETSKSIEKIGACLWDLSVQRPLGSAAHK